MRRDHNIMLRPPSHRCNLKKYSSTQEETYRPQVFNTYFPEMKPWPCCINTLSTEHFGWLWNYFTEITLGLRVEDLNKEHQREENDC